MATAKQRRRYAEEILFANCMTAAGLVAKEGQFLAVNTAYCDLLGYSEVELTSMTFEEVTENRDGSADREMADKVADGEITSYEMEKRYLTKRSMVVWVRLRVDAVRDSKGEFLCFLAQAVRLTPATTQEPTLTAPLSQPAVPNEVALVVWAKKNWPLLLWILGGLSGLLGSALQVALGNSSK